MHMPHFHFTLNEQGFILSFLASIQHVSHFYPLSLKVCPNSQWWIEFFASPCIYNLAVTSLRLLLSSELWA